MSDMWSHSVEWDKGYSKGHRDGYEQGRADGIKEYKEFCEKEIKKLWEFYSADKKNRPKPDLKSAYVIMNLAEGLITRS